MFDNELGICSVWNEFMNFRAFDLIIVEELLDLLSGLPALEFREDERDTDPPVRLEDLGETGASPVFLSGQLYTR